MAPCSLGRDWLIDDPGGKKKKKNVSSYSINLGIHATRSTQFKRR
jgi:hypothetical protein